LKDPNWSISFSHIPSPWLAPFLSAFIPQIVYKSSSSHPCHFSPEDGDSMFLWNVSINPWNHMVPKRKTTPTFYYLPWEPKISYNISINQISSNSENKYLSVQEKLYFIKIKVLKVHQLMFK
jgi:hypothetical protein